MIQGWFSSPGPDFRADSSFLAIRGKHAADDFHGRTSMHHGFSSQIGGDDVTTDELQRVVNESAQAVIMTAVHI